MSTNQDTLTPQQSFDIIRQIIAQAQGKVSDNAFYFLLWGWTIALCNFAMFLLLYYTTYPAPYVVWALVIPAWIVSIVYGRRQVQRAGAQSHIERISTWLWIATGIAVTPIVLFGDKIDYQINPLIMNMISLPTFVSGITLRFKPLLFGGITFFVLGIVSFLVTADLQYLIGGIAMVCGYLVPGYLLRAQRANARV